MAKKSKSKAEASGVETAEVEFALGDKEIVETVAGAVAGAADALAAFDDEAGAVSAEGADGSEGSVGSEGATSDELDDYAPAETEGTADSEDAVTAQEVNDIDASAAVGSELDSFASAEIEDIEEISEEKLVSIVESLLFASDKPQSIAVMKAAFSGTKVRAADIRRALEKLRLEYSNPLRGVELHEVAGGYQLRTKPENATYLQRTVKARPFKLSGPALEVLSIVAYKQPCTKAQVDEIRGVESGHLMRGLLERGLIHFGGKSDLPGRPMLYETTRKFLEIFGLRSLAELPTLNEIDQLIPEGIDETASEKPKTLSDLTGELSEKVGTTYSEGEEELQSISNELQEINLTTAFFEEEKRRQKEKRDMERAQDIRERLVIGEEVSERDKRWLERYEAGLQAAEEGAPAAEAGLQAAEEGAPAAEVAPVEGDAPATAAAEEAEVVEAIAQEALAINPGPESEPTL